METYDDYGEFDRKLKQPTRRVRLHEEKVALLPLLHGMWCSGKPSHRQNIQRAGHETIEPRPCWPPGRCIGWQTSEGRSSEFAGSEGELTTESAEGHGKKQSCMRRYSRRSHRSVRPSTSMHHLLFIRVNPCASVAQTVFGPHFAWVKSDAVVRRRVGFGQESVEPNSKRNKSISAHVKIHTK